MTALNDLARAAWAALVATHPEWTPYFGTCGTDDLEAAIPAPPHSRAGRLVVFSDKGENLWVRFSPPAMCYGVETTDEMISIIDKLVSGQADFLTTWRGSEWTGTTLISRGKTPELSPEETAFVVSWSGAHDRAIPEGTAWPQWK